MDITSLPAEAQRLIARDQLGSPLDIYTSPTISTLVAGIFMLIGAVAVTWFMFYLFSTFGTLSLALDILAFFAYGIWVVLLSISCFLNISRAISGRNTYVVRCVHGVVFLRRLISDSFRWHDVSTTFSSTSRREGLIYTVICRDGRHFVFQNLSEIGELAEIIDAQVARAKQS
jgi:hypothetical protein